MSHHNSPTPAQSDFVLIILKRLLVARPDLKVILMSASVNAQQFADYFGSDTPVCHIPGRLHPVEEYYLEDVIEVFSEMHYETHV